MRAPLVLSLWLASAAGAAPLTVTVLPFDNATGAKDYDVLQRGLAEMVTTDLAAFEGVTVVERARLDEVIGELKLQQGKLFDPKTAQKLGKLLGATHAVAGSLYKADPELRIDLRLVEVSTGKVLLGQQVVGAPSALFELEQKLVEKFVAALGHKSAGAASGAKDLDSLLQYSRAAEKADRGDLAGASAALAAVVRTQPDFKLAKTRYADVMRRMMEAQEKREGELGSGTAELGKQIDAELAGQSLDPTWRAMKGSLLLLDVVKLAGPPNAPAWQPLVTVVPPSRHAELKRGLRAFFDNGLQLLAMGSPLKERRNPLRDRAKQLGLGEEPDRVYTGVQAPVKLAELALLGEPAYGGPLQRRLRPTLAELDPTAVDPALKLFRAALEVAKDERDRVDVLVRHGDALLAVGRREEAVAVWQQVLDGWPTGARFEEVQERMKSVLGMSKLIRALDQQLMSCDTLTSSAFMQAMPQLLAADPDAAFAKAEKILLGCKGKEKQHAVWMVPTVFRFIGDHALREGDCKMFKRALEKTTQAEARHLLEQNGAACLMP